MGVLNNFNALSLISDANSFGSKYFYCKVPLVDSPTLLISYIGLHPNDLVKLSWEGLPHHMTEKFGHVVVSKKTGIPTEKFIIPIFSFGEFTTSGWCQWDWLSNISNAEHCKLLWCNISQPFNIWRVCWIATVVCLWNKGRQNL